MYMVSLSPSSLSHTHHCWPLNALQLLLVNTKSGSLNIGFQKFIFMDACLLPWQRIRHARSVFGVEGGQNHCLGYLEAAKNKFYLSKKWVGDCAAILK